MDQGLVRVQVMELEWVWVCCHCHRCRFAVEVKQYELADLLWSALIQCMSKVLALALVQGLELV